MTDVIKLDEALKNGSEIKRPPPLPKAQIVITLEHDGNISIQSNVANLYAAVGIMTSAVQGMLMAAKQPQSRIVVP